MASAQESTINCAQQLPFKITRQKTGSGVHRWTCICIYRHTFVHFCIQVRTHLCMSHAHIFFWSAAELLLKMLAFNKHKMKSENRRIEEGCITTYVLALALAQCVTECPSHQVALITSQATLVRQLCG